MFTALPAGAGRAERIDADILGLDLDFHFVGFRQHRDRDRGGVHAALLLGHRHALHAVHAALVLQLAVDLVAADQRDDFLEAADARLAAGRDFHLPALRLGVARVHAEDLRPRTEWPRRRPCRRGFRARRSSRRCGSLGSSRILSSSSICSFWPAPARAISIVGHLPQIGIGLLASMARACVRLSLDLLPLAVLGDDIGKFALRLGDLAVLVARR